MKNLKISTRLSGAFALLVLMLVGLAVAAMAQLSSMRAATVTPSSISTSSAKAPDRRVEIFKFFMESSSVNT